MDPNDYLHHVTQIATDAGALLVKMRQSAVSVQNKGFRDLVTEADIAAQSLIVNHIQTNFPHDLIIAEETLSESAEANNASGTFLQDPTWVIDPLDGTTNYSREIPIYGVCIAVAWHGAVQVSAVYLPVTQSLYAAAAGRGATLNGRPLKISAANALENAVVAIDWGRSDQQREHTGKIVAALLPKIRVLRGIGSAAAALVWIASEQLELYLNFNLKIWDVAAPGLILNEAGGAISGLGGAPWRLEDPSTWALSSNGALHDVVLSLLP